MFRDGKILKNVQSDEVFPKKSCSNIKVKINSHRMPASNNLLSEIRLLKPCNKKLKITNTIFYILPQIARLNLENFDPSSLR